PHALDRRISGKPAGRRADQLRLRCHGPVVRHRELCQSDRARRKAGRHADRAIAALLHGGQPQAGGIPRRLVFGCLPSSGQRGDRMKRREFITLIVGATAAWPLAARAQPAERVRRIAVLMNNAEDDPEGQARAEAFRQGLQALGWIEGKNLRIDWYWTAGDIGRTRSNVTELAGRPSDIIVANGRVTLSEAVQAIRSIPIIFVLVNDPVGQGFISSLARPGGNVTGFTFFEYSMFGKSLELLKKVAPAVTRLGCIFNPDMSAYYDQFLPAFETDARQHSIKLIIARAGTEAEIDTAVADLAAAPGGGLIVLPDAYTLVHRDLIVQSTAEHRIPAI